MSDDDSAHQNPKSEAGNTKTKAQFGRKQTHNEQVMLYTCGYGVGRATCYGLESLYSVKVSGLLLGSYILFKRVFKYTRTLLWAYFRSQAQCLAISSMIITAVFQKSSKTTLISA